MKKFFKDVLEESGNLWNIVKDAFNALIALTEIYKTDISPRLFPPATKDNSNKSLMRLNARGDLWDLLVFFGLFISIFWHSDNFLGNLTWLTLALIGMFAMAHKSWKDGSTIFVFLFALTFFLWFLSFSYNAHILSTGGDIPTLLRNTQIQSHGTIYYVTETESVIDASLYFLRWMFVIISILGNQIAIFIIKQKRKRM